MKITLIVLLTLLWAVIIALNANGAGYTTIQTESEQYVMAGNAPQSPKIDIRRTQIEKMILDTFKTPQALRIAICESGLNPNALNDNPRTSDYSVGLFQINLYGELAKSRPSEEWLRVPENNVAYAYEMYQRSGWTPWTCK